MSTPVDEGMLIAQGVYDYSVDDHPRAKEIWRMSQLPDSRIHMQTIFGSGQQAFFGMDLIFTAQGVTDELHARIDERDGKHSVALQFDGGGVRGQITEPAGQRPVEIALPAGTSVMPQSIALRYLVGQSLDLTSDAEQPLSLCLIPVIDERYPPLQPQAVKALATVLGSEAVELLMATVTATHVLIEWPNHPPQHGWFDERRFPVQWYWVGHDAQGTS
ncbi:MAG TPA: hypothetical protein VKB76_05620, partial [Ktedonobacterales bacterium]|nr:hypothetical protein [Ktedonobacterales bacterium]